MSQVPGGTRDFEPASKKQRLLKKISLGSHYFLARLAPTGGPLNYLKLPHSQGTLNTRWFSPA